MIRIDSDKTMKRPVIGSGSNDSTRICPYTSSPHHGRYHTMVDTIPWSIPYHGRYHTMVDTIPWSIPYHGRYHTMVDTIPWSIPYHGRYHTMVDTTPWSIPYHGLEVRVPCSGWNCFSRNNVSITSRIVAQFFKYGDLDRLIW